MGTTQFTCPTCGKDDSIYVRLDPRWCPASGQWEHFPVDDQIECTACDHRWEMDAATPDPVDEIETLRALVGQIARMTLTGEANDDAPGGVQDWDAEGAIDTVDSLIRRARNITGQTKEEDAVPVGKADLFGVMVGYGPDPKGSMIPATFTDYDSAQEHANSRANAPGRWACVVQIQQKEG